MTQPPHHRSDTGEAEGSERGSDVNVTAQAITNGATISVADYDVVRCTAAAACTGVILQLGQFRGQAVDIFNESAAANTITFAASGTSNVADGTSDAIAGLTCRRYVWNDQTSLWYPTK